MYSYRIDFYCGDGSHHAVQDSFKHGAAAILSAMQSISEACGQDVLNGDFRVFVRRCDIEDEGLQEDSETSCVYCC